MRFRTVFILLAALLFLFACGEESTDPVNAAPTADAGSNITTAIGYPVNLDGSASTDPEKQTLTYTWSISHSPAGSACSITGGGTDATATFTPDVVGTYTVMLTVNDGKNSSDPAIITVTAANSLANVVLQSATLPTSATSGSTISIPYSIQNSVDTPTGTFRVGIYLSDDATVTAGDTLIGNTTLSLAASGSTSGNLSATIPYLTSRKTYNIGVIADDQNAVTETDETDNKSSGGSSVTAQKVDWVVMVYVAADNSLSTFGTEDLNEMKAANLDGKKIRVITLIDQDGANDTYLYEVFNGQTKQLASTELGLTATGAGELNTGDPVTLSKFIQYTTNNYPATNYQLVIWNHGDGWKKAPKKAFKPRKNIKTLSKSSSKPLPAFTLKTKNNSNVLTKGICEDATSSSYIYNNAIQTVLTGSGIRLLSMDACLMAMVETAYEMRKSVTGIDYITFSQNTEPGGGYPYTAILNHYLSASDTSAANFATIIVDDYIASYSAASDVTQSAVDLSKIGAVVTALNNFVTYLNTQTLDTLINARVNSESYKTDYIDLYSFAMRFFDSSATVLKDAITTAVIARGTGIQNSYAKGLNINYPLIASKSSYSDSNNTYNIDLFNDSTWDNYIQAKAPIDPYEPDNDYLDELNAWNGRTLSGAIWHSDDVDGYSLFVASASGTITVSMTSLPPTADYDIALFHSSDLGNPVAVSANATGADESITYAPTMTGSYYLLVIPYSSIAWHPAMLSDPYQISFGGTATY